MLSARARLLAVAIGVFGVGCNAILGNDVHELASRGPDDARSGPDANSGHDATTADASGQRLRDGGVSTSDGAVEDTGSDQSVLGCNPNATECRDRSVFLCTPTGQ